MCVRIHDLAQELDSEDAAGICGGVPNAGTTNTVSIKSGSAAVSNDAAAIASSSSRTSLGDFSGDGIPEIQMPL